MLLLKADDNGNDVVESGKESTQKSPALSLKFLSMGSNPPPPPHGMPTITYKAYDHTRSIWVKSFYTVCKTK